MCKYCNNWKTHKTAIYKGLNSWRLSITTYDKVTPEMWIGNDFEQTFVTFPISYCPFCGKELK